MSWRHFVAGERHLPKSRARASLRAFGAAAAAQMKEEDQKDWLRDTNFAAGWGER